MIYLFNIWTYLGETWQKDKDKISYLSGTQNPKYYWDDDGKRYRIKVVEFLKVNRMMLYWFFQG